MQLNVIPPLPSPYLDRNCTHHKENQQLRTRVVKHGRKGVASTLYVRLQKPEETSQHSEYNNYN